MRRSANPPKSIAPWLLVAAVMAPCVVQAAPEPDVVVPGEPANPADADGDAGNDAGTPEQPEDGAISAAPGDAAPEPPLEAPIVVAEESAVAPETAAPIPVPAPPEPVPAIAVESPGADKVAEPEMTPEELRKSGAHLRPKRESALLKDHEVDVSKAKFRVGNGLEFKSKDGRFALATRLRGQFLYTLQHTGDPSETTQGLQIRRARIQFKGHFWNEHNSFKTEIAISPRDMGLKDGAPARTPILDWYLDFTYLRDLSFRIGQYKLPYSRQRVISSGDLQLVDRSIANSEFNIDRDIGFDFHSDDVAGLGYLRYNAGVYMGEGRDQYETGTFEMLYVGRVEVLPFGMFEDYKEGDLERSLEPRLSLGVGYAYHDGAQRNQSVLGSTPSDGGTTDYHNATADLMFKIAGFSLFSDFFFRDGKRKFGSATVEDDMGVVGPAEREGARDGVGWSVQPGYLVPRTSFEIAGRYGETQKLADNSGVADEDEAGGGLNYYFAGHPMKLQLDYFARWLDSSIHKTNHEVRLQLQASF